MINAGISACIFYFNREIVSVNPGDLVIMDRTKV